MLIAHFQLGIWPRKQQSIVITLASYLYGCVKTYTVCNSYIIAEVIYFKL